MIIKSQSLNAIREGKITLQFRKWTRPSVKQGTLLTTAIGQVEIQQIDVVTERQITDGDANAAGFPKRDALLQSLIKQNDGEIYKIRVRYHGEDPRIKLRSDVALSDAQYQQLIKKLQRLDAVSKEGPWTKDTLVAISKYPKVVSTELAAKLGHERMWLKLNIRKLKNLGLTISHEVGYEISPLGKAVLLRL
jgi:biotin operon repressor